MSDEAVELDKSNFESVDFGSDEFRQNWFDIVPALGNRRPFYSSEGGKIGVICTRHVDVREVLCDPERFSIVNNDPAFRRLSPYDGLETLSRQEGPVHTRQRQIMMAPFAPKSVAKIHARVQRLVDQLLDDLEARGPSAEFDARMDYSSPLMERLLLDEMFILNAEQKKAFAAMNESRGALARMQPGEEPSQDFLDAFDHAKQMLADMLDERAANPGDDFLSDLLLAEDENQRLTRNQVLGTMFGIASASTGTTPASIAFALYNLCRHPDQLELLRMHPEFATKAMEECLRYHPPTYMTFPRFAQKDTEVGGTKIEKGMIVQLVLAATNFDPEQFANPMQFDITRDPKNILTFGTGPHLCLAGRMARTVMQHAVMSIIERFPNLDLVDRDFKPFYVGTVGELGPKSMPMRT